MSKDKIPCLYTEKEATEIIPGLWLGSLDAVKNYEGLDKHKITNIIGIIKDKPPIQKHIKYFHFPFNDRDLSETDCINIMKKSTKIISHALKHNENVLVHCARGHHRSASVIAAFVKQILEIDIGKIINYIRNKRKCAFRRPTNMYNTLLNKFS